MTTLNRREMVKFVGWLGAGAAASSLPLPAAESARKPNIVLILADDYGLDGVGCYGSDQFKTPNLDALAQTGLRFETCYSTPLCGPTRCQIMTGRYPFRTGGLTNQTANQPKSQDEVGLAKLLKQAGYATCCAGKWRQMGETPGDWGFDEWATDPTAGGWYWQKSYTANGKEVTSDKEMYCPDEMHKFAMDFVRRHRQGPFFLYYPTHLIHGPILRTPDSKPDTKDFYADNIAYLDKMVGQIVAELDKLGIRENTLILFTTDNGTTGRDLSIGGRAINGRKGSMLEGGSRVPLIANWPGVTPAGKTCADLIDCSDFYPTLAELAGAKLPEGVTIDGRSFVPQLRGQKGNPRQWIFVQLGRSWYVREKDYKLNEKGELYDMKDAPFVEKPVPADDRSPEVVAARKRLEGVLAQLNPAGGKTLPPGVPDKPARKAKAKGEPKAGAKRAKKAAV
ncbi:MAG: sulfatase-like hydrolase/transferase [Candidatus Sumerlaeia bacterium]|nr:sulfatase-like hydrolase/transferase [Candidatus Sumerlaeia bacterium]